METEHINKCNCGAVTITVDGENYSMPRKLLNELFGKHYIKQSYYGCDYCVNHWGIDLCDCGSGEKFEKCNEGHFCCGQPSQTLGQQKQRPLWR